MKRKFLLLFLFVFAVCNVLFGIVPDSAVASCTANADIIDDVTDLFTGSNVEKIDEQVYLGG